MRKRNWWNTLCTMALIGMVAMSMTAFASGDDDGASSDGGGTTGGGCTPVAPKTKYKTVPGEVKVGNVNGDAVHQSSNDICAGGGGDTKACYKKKNDDGEWEIVFGDKDD